MNLFVRTSMYSLIATAMISCGSKSEDKVEEACDGCVGSVSTIDSVDELVTIDFSKASVDDVYIVMPFSIGNPSSVAGGTTLLNFGVPVADKSADALGIFSRYGLQSIDSVDIEKLSRTQAFYRKVIFNRWDAHKNVEQQEPDFWDTVRAYDRIEAYVQQKYNFSDFSDISLEMQLLKQAQNPILSNQKSALLTAKDCPSASDSIVYTDKDGINEVALDADEGHKVVSGTDFCIVYLDASKVDSEENIKASIEKMMSTYKEKIYANEFADTNGYSFKPYFVFMDFSKTGYSLPRGIEENFGFFDRNASNDDGAKTPMLFIASDFSKINSGSNADKAALHATIAHELQHGISSYFKEHINKGSLEITYIDEGIAHVMEDIFGYGQESFDKYAGNFLSAFGSGETANEMSYILPVGLSSSDDTQRGAAQSLIYYLASQKGGFEFEDGTIASSSGLDYIVSVVKSATSGANNLMKQYGSTAAEWKKVFGDYLASLILDGTEITGVGSKNQVQAPFKELTDLQGTKNKTFGMRFNSFGSIEDKTKNIEEATFYTPYAAADLSMHHYQTFPGLVVVKDPAKTYEIETPDDEGAGAVVIRLK